MTAEDDQAMRQNWFARVKHELGIHAHLVETIFYPALKQAAETRDLVLEAVGIPRQAAALIGMAAIAGLRLAAILWGLHLPVLPVRDD